MMLADLLANLAGSVLEVVVAPRGLDVGISDLILYDGTGPFEVCEGDLVLGVGVPSDQVGRLVSEIGRAGAVALVLKSPQPLSDALTAEAETAGIALLTTPWRASWIKVLAHIRSVLSRDRSGVPLEELDDLEAGDLFALANTMAALVGGPVVIEDPQLQVLAYSGGQGEADAARSETILGRGVSDRYMRRLKETGILTRLFMERDPIFFEGILPNLKPRLAVAVRAGDEILGAMSAAVDGRPTQEKIRAFAESANVVALHMLRQRMARDAERQTRIDLVDALVEGRPYPKDALDRLGVRAEAYRVMAAWICAEGEAAEVAQLQKRLWDAVEFYLSIFHVRAASALLRNAVYVVMSSETDPERSRDHALRIARDFVARSAARLAFPTVVGIGGHAGSFKELPQSSAEADQAMRVLREFHPPERAVAEIDEVRMSALLNELRDVASEKLEFVEKVLARLETHDARRGTQYLKTLRIYLESFGNVGYSSKILNVHPNTLRHRIRRIQVISGIDLSDPDVRLVIMLHLRMRGTPGSLESPVGAPRQDARVSS